MSSAMSPPSAYIVARITFMCLLSCAVLLAVAVGNMIQNSVNEIDTQHNVYALCLHELTRQVFVHCEDRGNLMLKAWKYVFHPVPTPPLHGCLDR
jgi:hypothetical protein